MTRQSDKALAERIDDLETRIEQLEAQLVLERTKDEEFFPDTVVAALLNGENPIKVWRKYRGFTLAELSDATDAKGRRVDIAYISEIERGKKPGSVAALRALAAALGVDLDDLTPAPEKTAAKKARGRRGENSSDAVELRISHVKTKARRAAKHRS